MTLLQALTQFRNASSLSFVMLAMSIGALVLAPIIFAAVKRYKRALPLLDGFVLASVGGLLLLHVLPQAIAKAGMWAIVVGFLGLVTPLVVERFAGMAVDRVHTVMIALAMVGLGLHSAADGVALHTDLDRQIGLALPLAVVLHRLPVGLIVWSLVRPKHGSGWALFVLSLIGVATMAGFFVSAGQINAVDGFASLLFQTFVAGSLLHVLVHVPLHEHGHSHDHAHDHGDHQPTHVAPPRQPRAETLGAVLGVLFIALLPLLGDHSDEPHLRGYGSAFLHLALESAPALVLGYLLAGIFTVFLPMATIGWVRRGRPLSQAARGVAFGIPIPICSCGVVPVYQGLIRRGIPATAGMAFLIATPEIGIESFLLSFPLLGVPMSVTRLLAAIVVAVVVGYVVGRLVEEAPATALEDEERASTPLGARILQSLRYGFGETVDATASWILVGLAIAAALQPASLSAWLARLPVGLDVVLFGLAGIPIYVCASGATPLAAALIFAGASPGAALAFLLAGPATNITTFGILSRLHSRRIAVLFGATVFVGALGVGYATNWLMPTAWIQTGLGPADHAATFVEWGALALLATAYFGSLVRLGPRATLAEVLQTRSVHSHGHPPTSRDSADTYAPLGAREGGSAGAVSLDRISHQPESACCSGGCSSAVVGVADRSPAAMSPLRVSLATKKTVNEKPPQS